MEVYPDVFASAEEVSTWTDEQIAEQLAALPIQLTIDEKFYQSRLWTEQNIRKLRKGEQL